MDESNMLDSDFWKEYSLANSGDSIGLFEGDAFSTLMSQ
jgi:hypothetical protein